MRNSGEWPGRALGSRKLLSLAEPCCFLREKIRRKLVPSINSIFLNTGGRAWQGENSLEVDTFGRKGGCVGQGGGRRLLSSR
ncbi:hypothetical protein GMJAKD_02970 [Candidatus Electrothrix aarhusensis]